MRRAPALAVALLTGAALTVPAVAVGDAADAAPDRVASGVVRHTTLGPVRGIDESRSSGTYAWLGIPYAEPPVGPLRWRAPVPHERWRTVRRTQEFGEGCIQPGRFFSPSPDGPHYDLDVRDGLRTPVGEEDCLTLNVFRPAHARADLPVIVFVHGGSNVVGYSADPTYDGRQLARRAQAVVVTVNYRLGLFGWLDRPGLKTGNPHNDSGNFGLLDQIEALRFVEANARTFGGDPDNVTVMGESAGAVNVWALMVSPLTDGLMDKAIPLSGGLQTTSRADARAYAERLDTAAQSRSGETSDPGSASVLRSMSGDDLVRLALDEGLDATPAVITDGAVVPTDPHAAIAAGSYREVPVLAGNTFEEGKLFGSLIGAYRPSDYDRFTLQYRFHPDRPGNLAVEDLIADAYLPVDRPGGWNDAAAAITHGVFTRLVHESMDTLAAAGHERLYYYQFGWNEEPAPFDDVYGSVHAMDLPFVFHHFGEGVFAFAFSRANRPGRVELSDLMVSSIRQFVRTGTPQAPQLRSRWEQWPRSMVFDADRRRAWARPGTAVESATAP